LSIIGIPIDDVGDYINECQKAYTGIVVAISCRLRIQVFQYTSPDILTSTDTSASSSVTLMLLIRGYTMHI